VCCAGELLILAARRAATSCSSTRAAATCCTPACASTGRACCTRACCARAAAGGCARTCRGRAAASSGRSHRGSAHPSCGGHGARRGGRARAALARHIGCGRRASCALRAVALDKGFRLWVTHLRASHAARAHAIAAGCARLLFVRGVCVFCVRCTGGASRAAAAEREYATC
jgi:hypothetical protein